MTEQQGDTHGVLAYLPKGIALVLLAGISGLFIWICHTGPWSAIIATLALGGFIGAIVGAVVGVPLISSLMAMVAFAGLFEGIVRGHRYGWGGAIIGGLIGIAGGTLMPVILLHFVLCLFGMAPLADDQSAQGGEPESPADDAS